jgi:hypothetical protein
MHLEVIMRAGGEGSFAFAGDEQLAETYYRLHIPHKRNIRVAAC